jgi:hypothetical protein
VIKDAYGNTRFYGVYRGIVTDTNDPLGKKRLRLKVPQILADNETQWAWPAVAPGTSLALPPVNEGVWVMFEGGDPSFPIWNGSFTEISSPEGTSTIVGADGATGPTGPTGPTGVAVANSPLFLSGPTGASLYIQDATTSVKGAVVLTDGVTSTSTTTAATPNSVKNAYDKITGLNSLSDVTAASPSVGETLVYNSSGEWVDSNPPSYNCIINGAFDIWQRGTSFTNPASAANVFTADRWVLGFADANPTSASIVRQSLAGDISGYDGQYFGRSTITTVGATTIYRPFTSRIEDVRTFSGKTATITFWAKADSARTLGFYFSQVFGTGGSATVSSGVVSQTLSTSWTRYSIPLAISSVSGKTIGDGNYLEIGFQQACASGSVLDITGVQLEEGSIATPFHRNSPSIQAELAACQRYYYRAVAGSTYGWFGQIHQASSSLGLMPIVLPVTMRATPTALDSSAIGAFQYFGATGTLSSLALSSDGNNSRQIAVQVNGSGFAANGSGFLRASNNAAAFIGVTAEL